jgi:hypothetical protein
MNCVNFFDALFLMRSLIMVSRHLLFVGLSVLSFAASADSLMANLNNNAAQVKFGVAASDLVEGNSELSAGIAFNDGSNIFGEAGLMVRGGEENAPGLSVGMGVKAVMGQINRNCNCSVAAMAVGGELTYALPTTNRVAFVGEYFSGPKIVTFADAERFNQLGFRIEVAVSPQANAYLGYRELGFGVKSKGSYNLDSGLHAGVLLTF